MMFIMICGGPVSGKTTTFNKIADHLEEAGVSWSSIDRSMKQNAAAVQIYRWATEKTSEVMLVDGYSSNVFTRAELLETLNSCTDQHKEKITKVAIYMDRTSGFMYGHNGDEGRVKLNDQQMRNIMRSVQQPIHQEGFNVIYHVKFNDYIDPEDLFKTIEKKSGAKLPG